MKLSQFKPLEWHFAEQSMVQKMNQLIRNVKDLFDGKPLSSYIKVVYTPAK
jgi:hypothetical protein